jgi:hypothetical protein
MQRLIVLKEELNGLAAVRVPLPQTHPLLLNAYGLSANRWRGNLHALAYGLSANYGEAICMLLRMA